MNNMDDVRGRLPNRPVRFLDQLREFMCSRNLAYKTEKNYCLWVKRFIRYHRMKHPSEMGAGHVEQYLHHLAVVEKVSVGTQKVALNALAFLYNQFFNMPLGKINITKARQSRRISVVFSHKEATAIECNQPVTEIYTHVLNKGVLGVKSPMDR